MRQRKCGWRWWAAAAGNSPLLMLAAAAANRSSTQVPPLEPWPRLFPPPACTHLGAGHGLVELPAGAALLLLLPLEFLLQLLIQELRGSSAARVRLAAAVAAARGGGAAQPWSAVWIAGSPCHVHGSTPAQQRSPAQSSCPPPPRPFCRRRACPGRPAAPFPACARDPGHQGCVPLRRRCPRAAPQLRPRAGRPPPARCGALQPRLQQPGAAAGPSLPPRTASLRWEHSQVWSWGTRVRGAAGTRVKAANHVQACGQCCISSRAACRQRAPSGRAPPNWCLGNLRHRVSEERRVVLHTGPSVRLHTQTHSPLQRGVSTGGSGRRRHGWVKQVSWGRAACPSQSAVSGQQVHLVF